MFREPSDEDYTRFAEACLTRPANYGTTDPSRYTTHAPVFAFAGNAGDLLAESNFQAMVSELERYQDPAETGERSDGARDMFTACENHWAFGPIQVIYVRVYEEDSQQYTEAWRTACSLLLALENAGILDQSAYASREHAEWERAVAEEVKCLSDALAYDDEATATEVLSRVLKTYYEVCPSPEHISADDIELCFRAARDAVYSERAEAILQAARDEERDTYYDTTC